MRVLFAITRVNRNRTGIQDLKCSSSSCLSFNRHVRRVVCDNSGLVVRRRCRVVARSIAGTCNCEREREGGRGRGRERERGREGGREGGTELEQTQYYITRVMSQTYVIAHVKALGIERLGRVGE